jgi:glucose-6-phosphate 1-dehydrogenase
MEPPARTDTESIRDERVKVLKSIPPLETGNLVRGQFRDYVKEKGVAPNSQVETYAALKLEIDSWRWRGVPFYIRAGKCLPVTITEVVVRLRRPPTMFQNRDLQSNHFRFRISPDNSIAFGLNFATPGEEAVGVSTEITGCRQPVPDDMGAYERVLGDAMAGDAALFAREDYVEEAWRIVDPALKASHLPVRAEDLGAGRGREAGLASGRLVRSHPIRISVRAMDHLNGECTIETVRSSQGLIKG